MWNQVIHLILCKLFSRNISKVRLVENLFFIHTAMIHHYVEIKLANWLTMVNNSKLWMHKEDAYKLLSSRRLHMQFVYSDIDFTKKSNYIISILTSDFD